MGVISVFTYNKKPRKCFFSANWAPFMQLRSHGVALSFEQVDDSCFRRYSGAQKEGGKGKSTSPSVWDS